MLKLILFLGIKKSIIPLKHPSWRKEPDKFSLKKQTHANISSSKTKKQFLGGFLLKRFSTKIVSRFAGVNRGRKQWRWKRTCYFRDLKYINAGPYFVFETFCSHCSSFCIFAIFDNDSKMNSIFLLNVNIYF